jgi:hypothetical protein
MIFQLKTVCHIYADPFNVRRLARLGFRFKLDERYANGARYRCWRIIKNPKIEFSTVEQIANFAWSWDADSGCGIVLDRGGITIYDGYLE